MEQLAAAMAEMTRFQQEQERRHDERQIREEELRRQQYEEHQEQVRAMQDQPAQQLEAMMETLRERRPMEHLKITPYEEGEDIQDFLEAFEGIMELQNTPARD